MKERQKSLERALEEAVSRALRDNLAPLQRTADELHQAYADLVAACTSSRPSNALPAMLRAQTAASSLAAGLSVLSNFVAVALNPREQRAADDGTGAATAVEDAEEEVPTPSLGGAPEADAESEWAEQAAAVAQQESKEEAADVAGVAAAEAPSQAFDLASLPAEIQDLHRRANRVAKVAMQDI